MRKLYLLFSAGILLSSCGSWVRIGDLTAISNRNVDDSKKYVLVARDVEAQANAGSDAMEQAIDNLTQKHQGEFVRNAKVYVRNNGKKVRVIGDVWAIQNTLASVKTYAEAEIKLNVGDRVSFKKDGKFQEGIIIGINNSKLLIEYKKGKKIELTFDVVTKITK